MAVRKPRPKRGVVDGRITVAGKAANGEGSVFFDAAKGSWRATYVDHAGKRRTVMAKTRAEVERRREVKLAELAESAPAHSRFTKSTTVAELGVWWLENVAAHRLRPTSLYRYRSRVERVCDGLGSIPVGKLGPEQIAAWQTRQLAKVSAGTMVDARAVLRPMMAEAVTLRLVSSNPVDLVKRPKVVRQPRRALTSPEARRLVAAAAEHRLGAAVGLLFLQGWRASEVLGLAWEDLDLDAGTARVRRAAGYEPEVGRFLGPCKTEGARGVHHLAPTSIELLRRRRVLQAAERLQAGPAWQQLVYEQQRIELVFTTPDGGIVVRQTLSKALGEVAAAAGVDVANVGTHGGRRTVVTTLYAEGGLDLGDVARHVGHASAATTAGYVRGLGERPKQTAEVAARLLDPGSTAV